MRQLIKQPIFSNRSYPSWQSWLEVSITKCAAKQESDDLPAIFSLLLLLLLPTEVFFPRNSSLRSNRFQRARSELTFAAVREYGQCKKIGGGGVGEKRRKKRLRPNHSN